MFKSEKTAKDMLSMTTTPKLKELWVLADEASITADVAIVRGWLIDELEARGAMVWNDDTNDFELTEVA